jgi:hypothetical protein
MSGKQKFDILCIGRIERGNLADTGGSMWGQRRVWLRRFGES